MKRTVELIGVLFAVTAIAGLAGTGFAQQFDAP